MRFAIFKNAERHPDATFRSLRVLTELGARRVPVRAPRFKPRHPSRPGDVAPKLPATGELMQSRHVMTVEDYEPFIGRQAVDRIVAKGHRLAGRRVAHI